MTPPWFESSAAALENLSSLFLLSKLPGRKCSHHSLQPLGFKKPHAIMNRCCLVDLALSEIMVQWKITLIKREFILEIHPFSTSRIVGRKSTSNEHSGQIIIFHQPRCPWNRGSSHTIIRYLLRAQVMWRRNNLTNHHRLLPRFSAWDVNQWCCGSLGRKKPQLSTCLREHRTPIWWRAFNPLETWQFLYKLEKNWTIFSGKGETIPSVWNQHLYINQW